MAFAWIRQLEIHLSSSTRKKKVVFGSSQDTLSISVEGAKYMSALKDSCTIKIDNLSYYDIVNIIDGKFYDVEVKAGYKSMGLQTIFKGGVIYISNSLNTDRSNTVIILCASQLIAKFGQKRLNISLNSSINMYSAIKLICRKAGIANPNVSTQLKKKLMTAASATNSTAAAWIETLAKENPTFVVNSDSIMDSPVNIFDSAKSKLRVIKLKNDFINLSGGYPQLTETGLRLSVMPTFSFMCGDIIELDNSIINLAVYSQEQALKNYGYYLDKEGQYVITEMSYFLQNRGDNFSVTIQAKSLTLLSNITRTIS